MDLSAPWGRSSEADLGCEHDLVSLNLGWSQVHEGSVPAIRAIPFTGGACFNKEGELLLYIPGMSYKLPTERFVIIHV